MWRQPDVIVIGAGIIGCAISHALARDGAHVLLLDAARPGSGASQASAGVLCPYIEGAPHSPLQALGAESLALYSGFIARVQRDAALDVPFVRNGTLETTDSAEGTAGLAALAGQLHAQGVRCQFVQGAAVREFEPLAGPEQQAALLIEAHGAVRVRDLVEALRVASLAFGTRILHDERVARVSSSSHSLLVDTPAHTFDARRVIVTAGAWSITLPVDGRPAAPTHPVRGQLLRLQTTGAGLKRVLWGRHCYLVPWGEEVLAGATVEDVGFDARATVAGVLQLCASAQALVPALSDATFSDVRVGLRPGSPDGLPIIGPSQRTPGLIYATGHHRNGALLTPITADLVHRLVHDPAAAVPPAFSPARFAL